MVTGVVTILQKEIPPAESGGGCGARLEQPPRGSQKIHTVTVSTIDFSNCFKIGFENRFQGLFSAHGFSNVFQIAFSRPDLSC